MAAGAALRPPACLQASFAHTIALKTSTRTRPYMLQDMSQKDKIMAEMKKELKKLQRLREQVGSGPPGRMPAAASAGLCLLGKGRQQPADGALLPSCSRLLPCTHLLRCSHLWVPAAGAQLGSQR